jgi:phosphoribosyl 1,2-cyclic phosphodiesterase
VKVTLWGTRGSLASPGPENLRYGGNTSCVEVRGDDGAILVLDAGTGIRRLGSAIEPETPRVDVLLTHLHLDHIQGLGFFDPLYWPETEVHIWGPPSATLSLGSRLARDFSTTLFPVRLGDLPSKPRLHDVPQEPFQIGGLTVQASFVCHPGPTLGFRISEGAASLAYLPDHEPALGVPDFPAEREWISGLDLAGGVDLLIHDAQYTADEYLEHVGWGHSAIPQTLAFAGVAGVRRLVTFHHDPSHSDTMLDATAAAAQRACPFAFELIPGVEGATFELAG